ncbi:hypothetical protein IWQ60_005169 [Tieghemiomyces parasiticus]|uniref:Uncharacterized protein n=1 Tax=Tieghemiomyces parasiticus TaxID=78921 RepID=A0A9W8A7H3_9FUNG|nr:hypothetical protein IWQ60_005169 [Tieghemiomyces parasiticus]
MSNDHLHGHEAYRLSGEHPKTDPGQDGLSSSDLLPPHGIKRSVSPDNCGAGWLAPKACSRSDADSLQARERKRRSRPDYATGTLLATTDSLVSHPAPAGVTAAFKHSLAHRDTQARFLSMWDPYAAISIAQISPEYQKRFQATLCFPYSKLSSAIERLLGRQIHMDMSESTKYAFLTSRLHSPPKQYDRLPARYSAPRTLEDLRRRVISLANPLPTSVPILTNLYQKVYGPQADTLEIEGERFLTARMVVEFVLTTTARTTRNGKPVYATAYTVPLQPHELPLPVLPGPVPDPMDVDNERSLPADAMSAVSPASSSALLTTDPDQHSVADRLILGDLNLDDDDEPVSLPSFTPSPLPAPVPLQPLSPEDISEAVRQIFNFIQTNV